MKFERAAGVLLHPTCLPGPYGIGDLGPAAFQWIDWLADSGCKLWQVLPLGPTGYGDSPYQCFSAFAGNPYLISLEQLVQNDLLQSGDLTNTPQFDPHKVDFGSLIPWKLKMLERAFQRFSVTKTRLRDEYQAFRAENASWLDDYALFMAIKESCGGGSWQDWSLDLRKRETRTIGEARVSLADSIERFAFYQFIFQRQWNALHAYAGKKEVCIIGDVPIFVAGDSADVWSHPDLFFLNDELEPTVVAGVPPDYFSPTGQLWGNPLYRWDVHRSSGYSWWLERLRSTLAKVDIVRIDHFRGFSAYWEIPAGNPTAEHGRWAAGPGADLFKAVSAKLGNDLPIIAEDLGLITPEVTSLRDRFDLPGMKVLQFAFSGPDNTFLPHAYPQNCVAYTGTHDNDTAWGWYRTAPENEKDFAMKYLRVDGSDFAWDLIRAAWGSTAMFAIAPLQDFLDLGTEARMNYPSRLGGNWEWRLNMTALNEELKAKIREMNWLFDR